MLWYDWVLWIGLLYMTVGSEFGLNWLTGVAFGKRIDKNSRNPFNRLYYYVWAATDPMHGHIDKSLVDHSNITAPINKKPLEPGIIAIDQINMFITFTLEIAILIGMLTHESYLRPAVFMFVFRGLLEMIYAAQLMYGQPGLKGWALINYLFIGLIPQTLIPFLLVMRFATSIEINILWWQPLVFVAFPYAVFIFTSIVATKNRS